jgi:eukaryotic-like serine/threonine-protein kinase
VKLRETLPRSLGRYELVQPLATGGMGVVYLGRSIGAHGFQREVAIKVLRPDRDEGLAEELLREAKIAGLVRHPNVVQVVDVGDEDGEIYLVMEYIDGDSLHGLLRAVAAREAVLPREVGLRVLIDALAGLHAAHELRDPKDQSALGLVHRDFSPQNLLIGVDGITRLTDFGIAKLGGGDRHTTAGIVKGKFSYMSPEQARSEKLDRRSDVWSAAVVAWETLTAKRLFPAGNDASTLLQIVSHDAPDPREMDPDIPASLADAVMCGLSRDVKQRCPTASAYAERLRDALDQSGYELASNEAVGSTLENFLGEAMRKRRATFRSALDAPRAPKRSRTASAPAAPSEIEIELENTIGRGTATTEVPSDVQALTSSDRRSNRSTRRLSWTLAAAGIATIGGVTLYAALRTPTPTSGVAADVTQLPAGESKTVGAVATVGAIATVAPLASAEPEANAASSAAPTPPMDAPSIAASASSTPTTKPLGNAPRLTPSPKPSAKKPKCSAWERCR